MHWKAKAFAFKVLEIVPNGPELHYLLQRRLTKNWPRPAKHLVAHAEKAKRAVADYKQYAGGPIETACFLEIGAGRDLAVPLALRMLGVGRVIPIDINRLAKLELVNHSAAIIAEYLGVDAPRFENWDDVLAYGIDYRAPYRIDEKSELPPIDMFMSTEVLEHIPQQALEEIFSILRLHIRPGGLSAHSIDYSDHYARDGGVSRYNFLRYSDAEWRAYNAPMHYVNRLRHSFYTSLHHRLGYEALYEECQSDTLPEEVRQNLAPEFSAIPLSELEIKHSRIIARR